MNNTDLISRSSVLSKLDKMSADLMINVATVRNLLKDEEGIDAVEVVRCKDCVSKERCKHAVSAEHYCGFGERNKR